MGAYRFFAIWYAGVLVGLPLVLLLSGQPLREAGDAVAAHWPVVAGFVGFPLALGGGYWLKDRLAGR